MQMPLEADFKNDLVDTIMGKQVLFGLELINAYCNLPNAGSQVFMD